MSSGLIDVVIIISTIMRSLEVATGVVLLLLCEACLGNMEKQVFELCINSYTLKGSKTPQLDHH